MRNSVVELVLGVVVVLALAGSYWCGNPSSVPIERTDAGSESGRVSPETRVVVLRIQQKQRIVDDLLAGRLTNAEAVARFRAINAAAPNTLALLRHQWPDAAEEELSRRNLETFVQSTLRSRRAAGRPAVEDGSPRVEEDGWD
jgi:hypothetical protein